MPISIITSLLALLMAPFTHQAPPLTPLQVDQSGWVYAATGAPVRLVGVNVDTYIFEDGRIPPPWFITDKDFHDLALWGANSFRLNMDYRWFVGKDLKTANEKGWQYLDWVVSEAETHRLYVILDMHIPVGGMQVGYQFTPLWSDTQQQQAFIDLWRQIAERYVNSPAIAGYYLIGEPTPHQPKQWQQLAQETLDAIRKVSSQVVIIEAPNSGDGDLKQIKPVTGENVMYAWQFYEPFPFTHQGASWEAPGSETATNVHYPGEIIEEFKTVRTDRVTPRSGPVANWTQLSSEPLTPPDKATHVTLRLYAEGGKGKVYFDDVQILEDGTPLELLNPGFEDARLLGERDDHLPDYWHALGQRGAVKWQKNVPAHSGTHCVVFGDADGVTSLRQATGSATGLYAVKPGASYTISVWYKGDRQDKDGKPAAFGMQVRWDRAEGSYWGPEELEQTIFDNVVAWSRQYSVPVYIPEFAASAAAPDRDDLRWMRDTLAIFDKYGLSWHVWSFRDIRDADGPIAHIMGLYDGAMGADSEHCQLDTELLDVLRPAFRKAN